MDSMRAMMDALLLEYTSADGGATIFVWRGDNVLKNYGSGLVIVSAANEQAAWERLKRDDFRVWFWLQTGISHVFEPSDAEFVDQEDYLPGYPLRPVAFTAETLPVLVAFGTE